MNVPFTDLTVELRNVPKHAEKGLVIHWAAAAVAGKCGLPLPQRVEVPTLRERDAAVQGRAFLAFGREEEAAQWRSLEGELCMGPHCVRIVPARLANHVQSAGKVPGTSAGQLGDVIVSARMHVEAMLAWLEEAEKGAIPTLTSGELEALNQALVSAKSLAGAAETASKKAARTLSEPTETAIGHAVSVVDREAMRRRLSLLLRSVQSPHPPEERKSLLSAISDTMRTMFGVRYGGSEDEMEWREAAVGLAAEGDDKVGARLGDAACQKVGKSMFDHLSVCRSLLEAPAPDCTTSKCEHFRSTVCGVFNQPYENDGDDWDRSGWQRGEVRVIVSNVYADVSGGEGSCLGRVLLAADQANLPAGPHFPEETAGERITRIVRAMIKTRVIERISFIAAVARAKAEARAEARQARAKARVQGRAAAKAKAKAVAAPATTAKAKAAPGAKAKSKPKPAPKPASTAARPQAVIKEKKKKGLRVPMPLLRTHAPSCSLLPLHSTPFSISSTPCECLSTHLGFE